MRFEATDGLDRTVLWNPNIDPRNANFGFINQDRNNPRDLQIGVRFTFCALVGRRRRNPGRAASV
jgi:hypothetical protein